MIWVHLCEWRDWKKKKEKEMVVGGTGSLSLDTVMDDFGCAG